MMSSPIPPRPHWLRMIAGALGAIASAAVFGAVIASLLSIDSPRARTQLQNPFDAAGSAR